MSIFERIAASVPVDKAAAAVANGKGVHWEAKINPQIAHQDTPLPVKQFPGSPEFDLTGREIGRLKVIGYAKEQSSRHIWVVRCACGRYEHRRSSAISSLDNKYARCESCMSLRRIKRQEVFTRTGKWPDDPKFGL